MDYLWGLDLGGTKVEGVVLQLTAEEPKIFSRRRVPTEAHLGYTHILDQIQRLIKSMQDETGLHPAQIGIGTPGTLDPFSKTLKNSNTVCLNSQPLLKDLEERLQLPVRMANDANCFALAEAKFGAVKQEMPDAKVVFGTIMGTGVGGGLIVDGQVIAGRQGIGGEWGHNFLDDSGGDCYCGKKGCVERIISGPALEGFYEKNCGEKRKLKEIIARARQKTDACAELTLNRLIHMFGKSIAVIINIVDPDVIVLGGGLGNIDELYTEGKKATEDHVFNNRLETIFLKPKLGDSAGVFGAALLFN